MTRTVGGYVLTEPPAEWWEQAVSEDQKAFLRVLFARRGNGVDGSRILRDRMLSLLGLSRDHLNTKAAASLLIDMHKYCSPLLSRIELEMISGQSSLFCDDTLGPAMAVTSHAQDPFV